MCLTLLRRLTCTALPTNLTHEDEIDRGLLLREAGLVVALRLQPADVPPAGAVLRVLAITARGQRALKAHQGEPVENLR